MIVRQEESQGHTVFEIGRKTDERGGAAGKGATETNDSDTI